MTLEFALVTTTTNSSTGTQTFSSTDFGGGTPKLALIWASYDNSLAGGARGHMSFGFGVCGADGSQWSVNVAAEHNQANTDTSRYGSDSHVIALLDPGSTSTFSLKAEVDSFTTNGVTLDLTTVDDTYTITVLLLGGDAVSYDIGSTLPDTGAAGTVTISSGFTPNVIWGATVGANITGANGLDGGLFGLGMAVSGSNIGFGFLNEDNLATDAVSARLDTSYPVVVVDSSGNRSEGYGFSFGSGDFDVVSESANAGTDRVYYCAVDFSQSGVYLADITTEASNGNKSYTDPGFEPAFVLNFGTTLSAVDTASSSGEAGAFSIGCMTSTEQAANSFQVEDASATTDTQAQYDPYALFIEQDNGSSGYRANYASMDASGWTWDYLLVTIQRKIGVLAVEVDTTPVSPGGGITPMVHNYRMRRV